MQRIIWAICCIFLMGCASHRLDWQSPYRELSSLEKGDILHVPTGTTVTKEQLVNMLGGARVIYVGEAHDNINSHKVQIEILKALAQRNPEKIAVGMEMLKRSSQESADQWISGELNEKDFVKVWVEDWSNDFQYYRSILHYMKEHKIPLVALRTPDEWIEQIKKTESADELPVESLKVERKENEKRLPQMDFQDSYHQAHVKAIFSKHPGGSQRFDDFYKIQVLWDESMAKSIVEYLESEQGQDKQILIFTGTQHIEYGFGIPRRVFRRLPLPYAIVLPMTVHIPPEKKHKLMKVALPEIPLQLGDFVWIVSYEDLDEEKVYLGVMVRDTDDGVKVFGTLKGSTSEKAGLQKNDIITALDGEPIETNFDLTYLIGLKKPGDKGVIEVLRDNEPLHFEVTFQVSHHSRASP